MVPCKQRGSLRPKPVAETAAPCIFYNFDDIRIKMSFVPNIILILKCDLALAL